MGRKICHICGLQGTMSCPLLSTMLYTMLSNQLFSFIPTCNNTSTILNLFRIEHVLFLAHFNVLKTEEFRIHKWLHRVFNTLWTRRYGKGGIEDKKVSREPFWRQSAPNPLDLSFMNNRNSTTRKNANFFYLPMYSWIRTLLLSSYFFLQSLFVVMRYADKSFFIEIICRKRL